MQTREKQFNIYLLFQVASFFMFTFCVMAAVVLMVLSLVATVKEHNNMKEYRNNIECHLMLAKETPYIDEMLNSMHKFAYKITVNKDRFSDSKKTDWMLFEINTIVATIQKDTGLQIGDKLDDVKRRDFANLVVEYSLPIQNINDWEIESYYSEGYAKTMMGVKNAPDKFIGFCVLCLFSGGVFFIILISLPDGHFVDKNKNDVDYC